MDLNQFNEIYNENDDFIPNIDLEMDQLMSSLEDFILLSETDNFFQDST